MALTLSKGQNLSLTKTDPGLTKVLVGLGWDERQTDGAEFDLDASAFMLLESGKVRSEADFIFYNQMDSTCGSVNHTGDNRTGEGDGDDEAIKVDLSKIPKEIQKIAITVTIEKFEERKQSFGQAANAFIRIVNDETNNEVVRYDLTEDYSTETAMVFGELYRHAGEWKFRAVGQGYNGGLSAMCAQYGVNLG
jgi:tellurium resistance protein TerD